MDIENILEGLDDNTKNALSIEIEMCKSGGISVDQLNQIINGYKAKSKKVEELAVQASVKRKMESLVVLLNKYPDMLGNIKALIDYRSLRIEQRVYADMLQDAREGRYGSLYKRDIMESKLEDIDRRRRRVHNKALSNFCGLMRQFTNAGMVPIYDDELMDPSKEKDGYGDHIKRLKMTDGMLGLLANIEDLSINELNLDTDEYKAGLGTFKEIYATLGKQTRDWGGRIVEDDGDLIQ